MPRNPYILILTAMGIALTLGFGAYVTLGWRILPGLTLLLTLPPGLAALIFLFIRQHPWIKPGTIVLLVMTFLSSIASLVAALVGPHAWLILVIVAAWALAATSLRIDYIRYRRWSRIQQVLCECCGYDLRASEGRCPECGTPIPEHYRWYRGTHIQNMLPPTGPAENPPEMPNTRD